MVSAIWNSFKTFVINATTSCHPSFDWSMWSTRKRTLRMLIFLVPKRLKKNVVCSASSSWPGQIRCTGVSSWPNLNGYFGGLCGDVAYWWLESAYVPISVSMSYSIGPAIRLLMLPFPWFGNFHVTFGSCPSDVAHIFLIREYYSSSFKPALDLPNCFIDTFPPQSRQYIPWNQPRLLPRERAGVLYTCTIFRKSGSSNDPGGMDTDQLY